MNIQIFKGTGWPYLYAKVRTILFDFDQLLQLFPSGARNIVEVGCGYGVLAFTMAEAYPAAKICASDFDKRRINLLKRINKYKNLIFSCEDAVRSAVGADILVMTDLLHHMPYGQQHRLLERIYKQAGQQTTIIVKDMDKGRFSFRQFCNFIIDVIHARQYPLYYHDVESFKALFEKAGFTIVKQQRLNKWYVPLNHIAFVLRKHKP